MAQSRYRDEGLSVVLAEYDPGAAMPPHRDGATRFSLALSGGFAEEASVDAGVFAAGDMLFKSGAVLHESRFGDAGARILSIIFEDSEIDFLAGSPLTGLWRRGSGARALQSGAAMIEAVRASDGAGLRASLAELLDFEEASKASGAAPAWLAQLKEELESESLKTVDLAQRAREAGVHPAHLSRLFRRCFGVSVTEYAQYQSVRRAIAFLADERAPLSAVAQAAGFYDQSHMSRTFRRVMGRTPDACRRLFQEAASGG